MERPPERPDRVEEPEEEEDLDATPYGAVFVTTVVAVVILALWFGMYALNLVRS